MNAIKKYLTDGEEILWEEKPTYPLINKYDLLCIPLTLLLFGGISFLFTAYLYAQFCQSPGIAFYFLTAGLLIYIISFYFCFGRFLYRKKRRSRETYVVTNKRALVLTDIGDFGAEYVLLSEAKVRIFKNSIFFSEENISSEVFYSLGLDALLKLRPKRAVVFRNLKNLDVVIEILKGKSKEGEIL